MTPPLEALLFDVGGVLLLPDPTVIAPLLAPYGASDAIEDHRRAHYAAMAVKSRNGEAERDWSSYNLAYVECVGVTADHTEHAAELLDRTRSALLWRWPIPESFEALRRLDAAGIPMGVVSNATGQVEAELLRTTVCQVGEGAGVEVRCIVDSHVVGVAKPDPRIFEFALDCFDGIDREQVGFVGDSVTMDVGGATAAGLHPILLDPYDDHAGADFTRIRSLADLASLLARH